MSNCIPPGFRPTLAFRVTDTEALPYPLWASPKIDGIRCVFFDRAYSRTLRPIRNKFVQRELGILQNYLWGMDGELTCGANFQDVSSGIMSENGEPNFTFHVFDIHSPGIAYVTRQSYLTRQISLNWCRVKHHETAFIDSPQALVEYEVQCLQRGFEGVMVRSSIGFYKYGRSTERESILGKIKRFGDSEARVIDITELMRNNNPPKRNAFGLVERADWAENKVGAGILGTLVCEDLQGMWGGAPFEIGTGFTAAQRSQWWDIPPIGAVVKYKYLPHGSKDLPRHPVFLGFRQEDDR